MSPEFFILFLMLIAVLAFLYASVGHGGASGYLALMALFNISPSVMKPTALILNIFVSLLAFVHYYRNKHFVAKIFLPIALASIPMAFLGGRLSLSDHIYKIILGFVLLIPVARFLFYKDAEHVETRQNNLYISLVLGAAIGFLSGLIGIGGGIILSPVLIFLRWSDLKQTAAISALFIFVNSVAGLLGQATINLNISQEMVYYILFALIGGYAGAYYGTNHFNQKQLRWVLALVLFIAAVKLIFV